MTKQEKRKTRGWFALGAALTALTLIVPQIGFLEWFTLIPVAVALFRLTDGGLSLRKAYGYGFLTVFVFYFVLYHWFVYLYPLDFVGLGNAASVAVVIAGWLGLTLLQAIPGGLIFLGFAALCRTRAVRRYPLTKPFLLAALWVVFEWSSTLAWTGVPWGRLSLGQIKMLPVLQSAALFGSYFVTFLLVAVNALLAMAILSSPRRVLCASVAAGLFVTNLLLGLIPRFRPCKEQSAVTAAVIQGNINSHDKWSEDSYQNTLEIYGGMTREAAKAGARLIVWPETALPYNLRGRETLTAWLETLSRDCDATLIVGALWTDSEGREYNSLFLITPEGGLDGEARYDKRHLVPFGEYVPLRRLITALIPPLAELSALDDDLTPGADSGLFETEWGRIGSLICFDSIYEQLAAESVRDGAALMVISSNDSWFYDSAAVRQHLYQAQLRAIETGRTYLRAANTGISDVILPDGSSTAQIGALETGMEVRSVIFRSTQTLYTVIGNLFVSLLIVLLLVLPISQAVLCAVEKKRGSAPESNRNIH